MRWYFGKFEYLVTVCWFVTWQLMRICHWNELSVYFNLKFFKFGRDFPISRSRLYRFLQRSTLYKLLRFRRKALNIKILGKNFDSYRCNPFSHSQFFLCIYESFWFSFCIDFSHMEIEIDYENSSNQYPTCAAIFLSSSICLIFFLFCRLFLLNKNVAKPVDYTAFYSWFFLQFGKSVKYYLYLAQIWMNLRIRLTVSKHAQELQRYEENIFRGKQISDIDGLYVNHSNGNQVVSIGCSIEPKYINAIQAIGIIVVI